MSKLDAYALFDLKLFFASLDDIRTAVGKILVAPPLARNPLLHFREDPLDVDWIDRQAEEWRARDGRIWGLFYRPAGAPQAARLLIHGDSVSHHIPRLAKCDALFIRSTGETSGHEIEWPIHEFHYYRRGESRRFVRAMKDGAWTFFEQGERFDWEQGDRYQARRKKDRMTRQMIVDYTRKLGVDLKDDSFWRSDHNALYWHYDLPQSTVPPYGVRWPD